MPKENHTSLLRDPLDAVDDGELLELYVQTGKRACLAILVRRHYAFVNSVVRHCITREQDIQDAVQTTFFVLVKNAKTIRHRHSVSAWLYGVAYRTANRLRQQVSKELREREAQAVNDVPDDTESPLSMLAKKMQLEALDEELQSVRQSYREVLVEHYLLGRTAAEIASSFNLSQSTVEGRLRRGRGELRARMLRRGFSFSAAIVILNTSSRQAASADVLSAMVDQIGAFSEPTTTDVPDSVSSLAAKEMSMTGVVTGKLSTAILATTAATVLGLYSLSSLGLLAGEEGASTSSGSGRLGDQEFTLVAAETGEEDVQTATYADPTAGSATELAAGNVASEIVDSLAEAPKNVTVPKWAARSPNRLREQLDTQMITVRYHQIPLQQALRSIADDLNIPIWLDQTELDLMGVDADMPITLELPEMPMRQVFKYMLLPAQLSYRLDEKLVVISSKDKIDRQPRLRAYDLSLLASTSSEMVALSKIVDQNIRNVEPKQWDEGVWNLTFLDNKLVVAASEVAHGEIETMLADLAQVLGKIPMDKVGAVTRSRAKPSTASGGGRSAAQQQNPFVGEPSNDPFGPSGGNRSSDPFGSDSPRDADPFDGTGPGSADPFGAGSSRQGSQNPFGRGNSAGGDPFGDTEVASEDPSGGDGDDLADPFGSY